MLQYWRRVWGVDVIGVEVRNFCIYISSRGRGGCVPVVCVATFLAVVYIHMESCIGLGTLPLMVVYLNYIET